MRIITLIVSIILTSFSSLAINSNGEFVLVIDPGHGGKDYGAIGEITNEKTINLNVATLFGKLVESQMKDVKVVYTRDTDVFVSLNDRAKIANKAKGDLFISIHVNSVDRKNRNRANIAGAEVFTLGLHKSEENLAVAKRENAVMTLESDFTESYKGFDPNSIESYIIFELSQSIHLDRSIAFAAAAENHLVKDAGRLNKGVKQAGFWVLWATSMPAVLVELDFICNPKSEMYMHSKAGKEKLAQALFDAFAEYRGVPATTSGSSRGVRPSKVAHPGAGTSDSDSDSATENAYDNNSQNASHPATDANAITFRIQILANPAKLKSKAPELKGETHAFEYFEKGMYKYTLGDYSTLEEARRALPEIRKKFSQAFIIKMQGDTRIYD